MRHYLSVVIIALMSFFVTASKLAGNSIQNTINIFIYPRIKLLSVVQYLSVYKGFDDNPVLIRFDFPYKDEANSFQSTRKLSLKFL